MKVVIAESSVWQDRDAQEQPPHFITLSSPPCSSVACHFSVGIELVSLTRLPQCSHVLAKNEGETPFICWNIFAQIYMYISPLPSGFMHSHPLLLRCNRLQNAFWLHSPFLPVSLNRVFPPHTSQMNTFEFVNFLFTLKVLRDILKYPSFKLFLLWKYIDLKIFFNFM